MSTAYAQARAKAIVEARRREGDALTFDSFVNIVRPGYEWYNVNRVIADVLQKVAEGAIRRLMIYVPPRIGKSELVSRLFPAYYLYRYPYRWIGLTSYGAELSYGFSRQARDAFRRIGGELRPDATSVKEWNTTDGGGVWAAGVGGPITGRGFHLGVVDDPIKDVLEAESKTIRKNHKKWYDSTFLTREEPGDTSIILCMTRWHEDDLAGHLLKREKNPETAEGWAVVYLPAKRPEDEEDSIDFPASCRVIDDWRRPGQYLRSRVGVDKFQSFESSIGEYFWSSLYQQTPTRGKGNIWKRDWFEGQTFGTPPEDLKRIGYDWDTAYTKNDENSASGYVKAGVDEEGVIHILDVDWDWLEFPDLVDWMESLEGPHFIEEKASGKSAAQTLKRDKVPAREVEVPGGADKVARTRGVITLASSGRVKVRRSIMDRLLDDEEQGILKFPRGSHDDVNDMLVQALYRLSDTGAKGIPEVGSVHF